MEGESAKSAKRKDSGHRSTLKRVLARLGKQQRRQALAAATAPPALDSLECNSGVDGIAADGDNSFACTGLHLTVHDFN